MGDIQEINEFVRKSALIALRERLVQIGLTPSSIFYNFQTRFSGVIGAVSIINTNIDWVELERKVSSGYSIDGKWSNAESKYRCIYIAHMKVDGLEKKLRAHSKLARKGIINRHYPAQPEWEGGELAQVLNRDALTLLPKVQVSPNKKRHCVVIKQEPFWDSWLLAFPTAATFKGFDRIAQYAQMITQGDLNTIMKPINSSLESKELYQLVDEILFYIWDPLFVSDEPNARDKYSAHIPKIISMIKSKLSKEQIAEYLEKIEREYQINSEKQTGSAAKYTWREYMSKMSTTERSEELAEILCSEDTIASLQEDLAFRVKYYQEGERKLDSIDRELYKRIDEVLFYVWDPIGVNAGSGTRIEYLGYVIDVLSLIKTGADKDAIAEHLGTLVETKIGLQRCREVNEKVAEILVKWRQKIYERN